jgi:hypothetical protein
VLKFSPEALQLATLQGSEASDGNASSYSKIALSLILEALASLTRIKNLSNVNAKESLVHGIVQELTALAVSSDLTLPQTDDAWPCSQQGVARETVLPKVRPAHPYCWGIPVQRDRLG